MGDALSAHDEAITEFGGTGGIRDENAILCETNFLTNLIDTGYRVSNISRIMPTLNRWIFVNHLQPWQKMPEL